MCDSCMEPTKPPVWTPNPECPKCGEIMKSTSSDEGVNLICFNCGMIRMYQPRNVKAKVVAAP